MRDDLAAAVHAFHEAQDAISDAESALAAAKGSLPEARQRLHQAIVAAASAGMRQREIVEVTGYNRESVRRILRAGGIEPE
ncbi:hypothetical protein [Micromonospora zhanjiangensis]|uniref:Uncharacterized protein n=1 Tax=Micromonospora zhanjiangensis TaxID=1522057 RepID=A0ABV8KFK4_9ACTN